MSAPSVYCKEGGEGETYAGFPARVQSPARRRPILRSKSAAPKKYDRPKGGRIFLSLPAIIVGNIIGIGLCWALMSIIIGSTANLRDYTLDNKSFAEYRGDANDANVVAVNIIWDSVNSERTDRQYVPFLNEGKEIVLNINGKNIPVSAFSDALPVLREELTQYALTLVMSENYYTTLGFDLKAEETIYTVKMTDESKNDVLEERLQGMLEAYPDYAFESRVQELADELQIQ